MHHSNSFRAHTAQAIAELASIAAAFAICDQALAGEACGQLARVHLRVGGGIDGGGNGSVQFTIAGELGEQDFTFASGTSCFDVAKAINAFANQTGVSAEAGGYAVLQSTTSGADVFVSVKQVGGAFPYVCVNFNDPCVACGYQGIDFGADYSIPGDMNCSGHVNIYDLYWFLDSWGHPCGIPCAGDFNGDSVVNIDDLLLLINNWDSDCN